MEVILIIVASDEQSALVSPLCVSVSLSALPSAWLPGCLSLSANELHKQSSRSTWPPRSLHTQPSNGLKYGS